MITKLELDFLRESNNIESEFDDLSLCDSILAWQFIVNCKLLTINDILETHRILMKTRDTIEDGDKGRFRDGPIWIGGHEGKPWPAIPALMDHWIVNANDLVINGQNENEDLLEDLIQKHHVDFETFHPFFDGNGRSGRIFMNWQRTKVGLPILIIHTGKEQQEYYKWFN